MSTELTVPGSSSILNKKIRSSDLILTVLIDLAAAFSILLLIAIMGYVFFRGLPQISLSFLNLCSQHHQGNLWYRRKYRQYALHHYPYPADRNSHRCRQRNLLKRIRKARKNRPADRIYDRNPFRYSFYHFRSVWYGIFRNHPGTWLFHPDRCPDPDPDGSSPDHAKHTGSLKNSSCDLPQRRTRHRRNQMVHDPHNPASLRNARHYHRYHTCDRTYRRRIRRPFIHRRKRLSSAQDLCRIFQKNLRIRRNPYDPAVLEHVQGTI